jgi:hypothetical protein
MARNRALRSRIAAAFVVLALFALAAGPAVGGGARGAAGVVLTAPYKGGVTPIENWATRACGKARIIHAVSFQLATGVGGFSAATSSRTCGHPFGEQGRVSYGQVSGEFDIGLKIPGRTGSTTIVANWTFTATGSAVIAPGVCTVSPTVSGSQCFQAAIASVAAIAWVDDLTNGSRTYSTNGWSGLGNASYNDSFCYNGTCRTYAYGTPGSFSGSSSPSLWFNITGMKASHHYLLVLEVQALVIAENAAYNTPITGGSAAASLNFATLGNGAVLNGVTES